MVRDFELERQRRALFGDDAVSYDEGRPGYPARVYELLRERCGLQTGCRVVEIGPGTGQATAELLAAGAEVTAVELNDRLARRLREKHPTDRLTVTVSAFEEATLPKGAFDLAAAATSFHWVPPDVALQRVARALRPGGSVALWWTVYGDAARPDPFHDRLHPIIAGHAPEVAALATSAGNHPHALDRAARVGEIDASGAFGPVYDEVISWTGRHTAGELRMLFASFSPWLALAEPVRTALLDDVERLANDGFGGVVERPYLTPIYITQRV